MKKTRIVISLVSAIIVLIVTFLFLRACNNQSESKSGFYNGSAKSSQTSSSSKTKTSTSSKKSSSSSSSSSTEASESVSEESQSSTATSEAVAPEQSSAATTNAETEQSSDSTAAGSADTDNVAQAPSGTGLNVDSLANGDMSAIAGTWTNDLGESITISADGQVTYSTGNVMMIAPNRVADNVFYGGVYNPNSEYGGAGFIVIPGGTANPHIGGVSQTDTIVIGQSVDADDHPYYRN